MAAIAKFSVAALDCQDPLALARFYSALTGCRIAEEENLGDQPRWVELTSPAGAILAFQRAPGHVPPTWPSDDHPQQVHLDFDVPDLDAGEQAVLALGARKAETQPGTSFRVYLDPAGHPFCLVLNTDVTLD